MNAKWSISNRRQKLYLLLTGLWLIVQSPLSAVTPQGCDSLITAPDTIQHTSSPHNRYDKRVHRYRKHWEKLIPTYSKLQFAGNMGLLSVGTGWDYGKRDQWETDIFLGFLPKYQSDKAKLTFTLKQNYIPWSLPIKTASLPSNRSLAACTSTPSSAATSGCMNPNGIPKDTMASRRKYAPTCFWDNGSPSTFPNNTAFRHGPSPSSTS